MIYQVSSRDIERRTNLNKGRNLHIRGDSVVANINDHMYLSTIALGRTLSVLSDTVAIRRLLLLLSTRAMGRATVSIKLRRNRIDSRIAKLLSRTDSNKRYINILNHVNMVGLTRFLTFTSNFRVTFLDAFRRMNSNLSAGDTSARRINSNQATMAFRRVQIGVYRRETVHTKQAANRLDININLTIQRPFEHNSKDTKRTLRLRRLLTSTLRSRVTGELVNSATLLDIHRVVNRALRTLIRNIRHLSKILRFIHLNIRALRLLSIKDIRVVLTLNRRHFSNNLNLNRAVVRARLISLLSLPPIAGSQTSLVAFEHSTFSTSTSLPSSKSDFLSSNLSPILRSSTLSSSRTRLSRSVPSDASFGRTDTTHDFSSLTRLVTQPSFATEVSTY